MGFPYIYILIFSLYNLNTGNVPDLVTQPC
jgi:hypothetical protein